ncbi:NfeD family protein [Sphingomonas xinjiangensis]|uniref:NfeD-like C-terminal domain-containing protein n=1 Tax=Sphingomonas xinjiangensis TaxID=643568 RepID=A0A840YP13_9SPHN|nr:NfeD family protein [Sphingomonas xinjiangensis]MBB5709392.1 hypothetical protein [Sphingomonas xinjiangensis]
MDSFQNAAVLWLIGGVLLATAELLVPGVYLVFFAAAAAITGALALLFPELSLGAQLAGFAAWSLATVLVGKRWYRDFPVATADPLLNDRLARLVGETVTVVQALEGGEGRVRVGDGEWIAHGPDQPVGARVRITGAAGGSLTVEPVRTLTA